MSDNLEDIERKTREEFGLSKDDLEFYRATLRIKPSPICPRPLTAAELRNMADEIDALEKLFEGEQKP